MKIVAIDPSINNVGWGLVEGLREDSDGIIHADDENWRWGNWKIASHSFTFKLREIVEWMILTFDGLDPECDWVVLEWPAYFDSMAGHVAAKAGHTINLAAIDGYIAGFFRLPWQRVHLITATKWKGSVSKEITRMRFFRHMGIKQIYTIDHNAVDAVMMLLEFCRRKRISTQIVSKTMDYLPQSQDDL
jgi:hypothetical protein